LSASSFVTVRAFQTMENWVDRYPFNVGSFTDSYFDLSTWGTGTGAEYNAQLNAAHSIGLGADYTYYTSKVFTIFPSFEPFATPLETNYIRPLNMALNQALIAMGEGGQATYPTDPLHAPLTTYPNDAAYTDDPVQRMDMYLKDLYQPNDRFTADVGVRFDEQIYRLPANAASQNYSYVVDDSGNYLTVPGPPIGADVTRPSQVSPRVALSYKVDERSVLRFSYGTNIEFEPESGIESKYRIPASYANCSIASGCFVTLPGYSATCVNGIDPQNANARCNGISNLYEQTLADLNTNNFLSYTPGGQPRRVDRA
jgi:outer membrane receptor protein involved in Fe transport